MTDKEYLDGFGREQEARRAEAPYAAFADMAVQFIRQTAREAQQAAAKENATAESVLAAVMKYHEREIVELRAAAHRETCFGVGMGLKYPTPGEESDRLVNDPAAMAEHEKMLAEIWKQEEAEKTALGIGVGGNA